MSQTIVVIEDDAQIRRVVEGYLQQAGYRVFSAADGVAGLALVRRERPSLLVLDLMLPGLDGWEITRRLRSGDDPTLAEPDVMRLDESLSILRTMDAIRAQCGVRYPADGS